MTKKSTLFMYSLAVFILILSGWLCGCIKLVSDYDITTFDETLMIGKEVVRFYGDLLETPESDRPYSKYSDKYVEIETNLRSLYMRNEARALNQESTEISKIILGQWVKCKKNHKEKDVYKDGMAELDRDKFMRLFNAAVSAEAAKKLNSNDKDIN